MQPTRLGPYTIGSRLGRGGMGTVYEAIDSSGTAVAVKTLTAHLGDDPALRRRFEAEIDALKALRHPGIVRLLAFGEEEGRPFFAMELVAGRSLEEILREGQRFDWRRTVAIAGEITRALKSAHDQGIVHRDLKPANLLFPADPAAGAAVKLADFGIARLFGDAGHTQAGTVVGTAEYMAPEQAAGEPVDARADLYSLGLVMFAMLTGRPPFRGGSMSEVLRRQRTETPPRVTAVLPEVPPAVDELIARLLAKSPGDRPASALAVGRLLAAIEAAAPLAGPSSATLHDSGPTVNDLPPPVSGAIDLLAATRVGGSDAAARLTIPSAAGAAAADGDSPTRALPAATQPDGASLAHRPTAPDVVPTPAGGTRVASRFTTVEELHDAARRQAARTARRDGLLRLLVAVGLLAAVALAGFSLLKPVTADQLHARIAAIAAEPAGDRRDARPLIDEFLSRFPDDSRAGEIRLLDRELQLDALERRARRRPRDPEGLEPLEREYRAAMDREPESPLACLAALEAILTLHGGAAETDPAPLADAAAKADAPLWLALVRRQIARIEPLAEKEREEDAARAEATLAQAAALAREAEEGPAAGPRADLLARRRQLLAGLVEIYGSRPHVAAAVAEARRLLRSDEPNADPLDESE